MYVLNLFGGPCAGKSTVAATVFGLLKMNGVNVELVTEYAKDLTWEERDIALQNQNYIFGKQYHKMWRLKDKVDLIITDSPLILGLMYAGKYESKYFVQNVVHTFMGFDNLNYYVKRNPDHYSEIGRNQTLDEAKDIDKDLINFLLDNKLTYTEVVGNFIGVNHIVEDILELFSQTPRHYIGRYDE